ncbi:MAG: hypothetical protein IKR73_01790 [Oscillospiraceae bacterium]|nr:hypothetical protein [Oscillospiraceae bacterium]
MMSAICDIALCLIHLGVYILPCVALLIPLKRHTAIPSFVFRKLLHIVAFTAVALVMTGADKAGIRWWCVTAAWVCVAVGLYPVLMILEHFDWFSGFFVEKSKGEIKRSLIVYFLTVAVLSVADGLLRGGLMLSAVAVIMWGTGDAAAALIGIPFGKHSGIPHTDGKKSLEGTAAMFLVSALCGTLMLMHHTSFAPELLLITLPAAAVGAAVELWSPSEYDTVTVPCAIYISELFASFVALLIFMVE